ncbi:MAG: Potassium channel related protein [Parcubacteria group bacterium GW2011_GWA2_31_28]|nr:MAG: Potassium channel related protein [Parcubacteria group bacterium GW2011_GWA2_31_28]
MSNTNVKILLEELKDTSALMLDLAYSSIFFNNKEIAEEVMLLYEKIENVEENLYMHLFSASRGTYNSKLISLIDIVESTKNIANAARNLANLVIDGRELHPVIKEAIEDSDELISRVTICENSSAINKTLRELGEKLAVNMIAIRRKKEKEYKWIFDPKIDTKILAGDTIIIVGHESACNTFKQLLQQTDDQ